MLWIAVAVVGFVVFWRGLVDYRGLSSFRSLFGSFIRPLGGFILVLGAIVGWMVSLEGLPRAERTHVLRALKPLTGFNVPDGKYLAVVNVHGKLQTWYRVRGDSKLDLIGLGIELDSLGTGPASKEIVPLRPLPSPRYPWLAFRMTEYRKVIHVPRGSVLYIPSVDGL